MKLSTLTWLHFPGFFNVNNTITDISYFCTVSEVILHFLYSEPELIEHLMQMQPESKPQIQKLTSCLNHILNNSNIFSQFEQPQACKVQLGFCFFFCFKEKDAGNDGSSMSGLSPFDSARLFAAAFPFQKGFLLLRKTAYIEQHFLTT